MGDDLTTSFGLVQRELDEAIAAAKAGGCTPEGHAAVCRAIGTEGRMIGYVHTAVRAVPGETVALLRAEVVTLVQAHAEDAVIRHLSRRVPVDGNGRAVSVTRDTSPQLPGFWGGAFQMLQKVGVPGAIVSACAVVGLALWVVLEVVRK